jgi:hypothetical protein
MNHAIDLVLGAIVWLISIVAAGIDLLEGLLRGTLAQAGITGPAASLILLLVGVLLVVLAFRLFGRLLGILIIVFLVLLGLHWLLAGHPPPSVAA